MKFLSTVIIRENLQNNCQKQMTRELFTNTGKTQEFQIIILFTNDSLIYFHIIEY